MAAVARGAVGFQKNGVAPVDNRHQAVLGVPEDVVNLHIVPQQAEERLSGLPLGLVDGLEDRQDGMQAGVDNRHGQGAAVLDAFQQHSLSFRAGSQFGGRKPSANRAGQIAERNPLRFGDDDEMRARKFAPALALIQQDRGAHRDGIVLLPEVAEKLQNQAFAANLVGLAADFVTERVGARALEDGGAVFHQGFYPVNLAGIPFAHFFQGNPCARTAR